MSGAWWRTPWALLTGAAVCLAAHFALAQVATLRNVSGEAARLQAVMTRHERAMATALDSLARRLTKGADTRAATLGDMAGAAAADYSFYLFRNNRLAAWHRACLPVTDVTPAAFALPLTHADNGLYYVLRRDVDRAGTLYALLRVRCHFPFDNEYLADRYHPSFGLPDEASLSLTPAGGSMHVRDETGRFLFAVSRPQRSHAAPTPLSAADATLLAAWVALCVMATLRLLDQLMPTWRLATALILAAAIFATLYLATLKLGAPIGLADTFAFGVDTFAYDWWLPSLAHFALMAALLFVWCYIFYRHFNVRLLARHPRGLGRNATAWGTLVALPTTIFVVANLSLDALVHHSRDLLIYIGDLDLGPTTLLKLLIVSVWMMSFLVVLERVYSVWALGLTWRRFLGVTAVSVAACAAATWALYGTPQCDITLALALFMGLFLVTKRLSPNIWRFNHFIWAMMLTACLVFARLTWLNHDREWENRQVLATNLSMQLLRDDDPIGERILPDIEAEMLADTALSALLRESPIDDMQLFAYVRNHHFSRYFANYNIQVVTCPEATSWLTINNTGEEYACVPYFTDLLGQQGRRVEGSRRFWCLLDGNGLPSYLGVFHLGERAPWLYVQLDSRALSPPGVGYPELLTNRGDRLDQALFKGYSYARYFEGHLSQHYGEYDYPLLREAVDGPSEETANGWSHLVCPPYQEQMVVLSYPVLTATQAMSDFSYITLGLLLSCFLLLALSGARRSSFLSQMTIGERIQLSLSGFVMGLFIVVILVTGRQGVASFETESRERMSHVLGSLQMALADDLPDLAPNELANIPHLLDASLHRSAALFEADAHIFDLNGRLAGSSKRELFKNGLMAPLMNDAALAALHKGGNEAFVTERIGAFTHYAIYAPLLSAEGRTVGYLNVPYFTDLNSQRRQLYSTLLPIANSMMVVMLVAIVFSYLLARAVMRPLAEVRDTLRSVDLSRRLTKINYKSTDEVGELIGAYNGMTEQLRRQAERLASTEREATWREMARQIAHEIKNPLTPMKLSVQYMQRVWQSGRADFADVLGRTVTTLVEQIDQLAAVASGFSDVAKMRLAEPTVFDLAQRAERIVGLFNNSENATVDYRGPAEGVLVKADPDQMASVLNNLIKNALQSRSRPGEVHVVVSLAEDADNATLLVSDNGDGIPDEVAAKIFRPNFSTKSTGMGLGLAIAKTVCINAGGDISFTTAVGQGTTFKVEIPLYQPSEQHND